jgi:hypothetical protein
VVAPDVILENLDAVRWDEVPANKYTLVGMASTINAFQRHVAVSSLKARRHEGGVVV